MYLTHFQLSEAPFAITPDPRFLYMSDGHREALAHLLYGIGEGGGFVQLTGEVGTGKTTLCRCLLEQLPPEVDVALILNPRLTDMELLATLCDELRVAYPAGTTSRKLLVDTLYQHLLDSHGRGRRTVLIIDEAQDLAPDVLEQVRLLTNLETRTQKLLQIILIGQPELIRLLDREDLRQLAQRVTARYHLLPFSERDTSAYIRRRLQVAGQKQRLFTDDAARQVHHASRGIPRLINAICDRALLGAFARDQHQADRGTVRRAAAEVLGRPVGRPGARPWHHVAAASLAAVALGLAFWTARAHGLLPFYSPGSRLAEGRTPPGGDVPAIPPVSAAEAPGAAAPPLTDAPRPRPIRLAELLADRSLPADQESAFAGLYARWGLPPDDATGAPGCDHGRALGFRCLNKTGAWPQLRRVDLPAIIALTTEKGERRYGTVAAVDDATATLDFKGRRYAFPHAEIDPHWDGGFIVLWKRPALSMPFIGPGTRGKDVAWLRRRLEELDGVRMRRTGREVFDDELRARVISFQRSRSLLPDGVVGDETLAYLTMSSADPAVPRLSRGGS